MKPMKPIILENGRRYLHTTAAAQIVGITQHTMWRWAANNMTSFGLELDVIRQPPPTGWHHKAPPKKPGDFRLLVPEEKVMLLKRLLHDFPINGGGYLSEYEIETLQRAARLYTQSPTSAAPSP